MALGAPYLARRRRFPAGLRTGSSYAFHREHALAGTSAYFRVGLDVGVDDLYGAREGRVIRCGDWRAMGEPACQLFSRTGDRAIVCRGMRVEWLALESRSSAPLGT
jgi:hypothetical protein